MENKNLNNLPQDIQDLLLADIDAELNEAICQKYGLTGEQVIKNTKIVSGLLLKKINLNQLVPLVKKALAFDEKKAKAMALDVAGKRLLIFDNYFGGGVSQFIKSLAGNLADYKIDIDKSKKAIAQVRAEREKEVAENQEPTRVREPVVIKESNDAEEKQHAPAIFKASILDFLRADDEELKEIIDDYNGVLIILLEKDANFKKNLEQALYENQELIGPNKISIGGKFVPPTVADWLNDFKAKYGTNLFSNVNLSEYLTNSPNAKKLNAVDRKLLGKLLVLYRNVKFFPQSLANQPENLWAIIPLDRAAVGEKFAEQELASPVAPWEGVDLENLSPIELKAFMEANNLTKEDLKRLKQ